MNTDLTYVSSRSSRLASGLVLSFSATSDSLLLFIGFQRHRQKRTLMAAAAFVRFNSDYLAIVHLSSVSCSSPEVNFIYLIQPEPGFFSS